MGIHGNAGLGHQPYHQGNDRQQRHQYQSQHRIHSQHHGNAAHQQNGGPDANALDAGQKLIYIIGIAGKPGFGGRNRQFIHLPGRQPLKFGKQIVAQGSGDLTGANGAHAVGYDIAGKASQCAEDHQPAVEIDLPQQPCRHFIVDHNLHQIGDQQLQGGPQQLDHHRQGDEPPIGLNVFFQAAHIIPPPPLPLPFGRSAAAELPAAPAPPGKGPAEDSLPSCSGWLRSEAASAAFSPWGTAAASAYPCRRPGALKSPPLPAPPPAGPHCSYLPARFPSAVPEPSPDCGRSPADTGRGIPSAPKAQRHRYGSAGRSGLWH